MRRKYWISVLVIKNGSSTSGRRPMYIFSEHPTGGVLSEFLENGKSFRKK